MRERFHAERHLRLEFSVLIRRYAFDLRRRQWIGPYPGHAVGAVFRGVPSSGRVSSYGPFTHVSIVQIGNPQVPILGAIAGKVATRTEPRFAYKFEPRLKGVANIGVEAMNGCPPIDEEDSEGTDALSVAVRRRVTEQAGMGFQHQTAAASLFGRAVRHEERAAAAVLDGKSHDAVFRRPNPLNHWALHALGLAVLAKLLG